MDEPSMAQARQPIRLYKFCTYDVALAVLTNERIKLSEFHDMNDPFELAAFNIDDHSPMEFVIDRWREKLCALCLTTDWQHPLMWSHYADKYKGVCLGLDYWPRLGEAHSIDYVETIGSFNEDLEELLKKPQQAEQALMKVLLAKFDGWKYESEVRILATRAEAIDGMYFYKLGDRLQLKTVILGPRCREALDLLLLAKAKGVTVERGTLSRSEFKIVLAEPQEVLRAALKAVRKVEINRLLKP